MDKDKTLAELNDTLVELGERLTRIAISTRGYVREIEKHERRRNRFLLFGAILLYLLLFLIPLMDRIVN